MHTMYLLLILSNSLFLGKFKLYLYTYSFQKHNKYVCAKANSFEKVEAEEFYKLVINRLNELKQESQNIEFSWR